MEKIDYGRWSVEHGAGACTSVGIVKGPCYAKAWDGTVDS